MAEGEKGPIVAAFARVRVYLKADRTAESERWLMLRNDPDGKIKYALSNAPEKLAMLELVRVSQARWPIERCFEENKSELGTGPLRTSVLDGLAPAYAAGVFGAVVPGAAAAEV